MEQFENNYVTTLNGAINNSVTSITVTTGPVAMTGPFRILIDSEIIYVGAAASTSFTSCVRGAEGTTAASHSSGAVVTNIITAASLLGLSDPIFTAFGTPDTAFEFNTTSLSGLTALSNAATTVNANTTISGHYFIKAPAAGMAGHYAAIPAYPWTAVALVTDSNARGNYGCSGMFVGTATPGSMRTIATGYGATVGLFSEQWTNPTTFSTTPASLARGGGLSPTYFAIRAASNTNVDFLVSYNGFSWFILSAAINLGITIGSVGIFCKSDGSTTSAGFDFFRIWNSSKTFAGE